MVLAALAVVWVVVLGSYARERFGARRQDSVSAFRVQLSTLERTQPGSGSLQRRLRGDDEPPTVAHWWSEAARLRRRNIFLGLVSSVVFSAMLVVSSPSTINLIAVLLCTLALAGYTALVVNQQRIIAEQQAKVRRIRPSRQQAATAVRPVVVGLQRRS